MSEFSQRLRKARMAKEMTQLALATQLSISRGTLANWEIGRTTPDPETIHRLAVLLETSTDALLGVRNVTRQPSLADGSPGGRNVPIPVIGSVEVASFGLKYSGEHGYEPTD
ncbi:MAG: helix-turn-helix transcriptional regulator, partial [Bacillota bacterium]|nr:helix-turn-helix transcriptional regulator [Bacillota bacterium]